MGHAYLFFGPAAVGKLSFAVELAEYLERGLPSQISGKETRESNWPEEKNTRPLSDAMVISPNSPSQISDTETWEGKSGTIGIDAARSIRAFLSERPFIAPRRTVVIDRADALTDEAQNALLKIAEEPPSSGLLMLVLQDPESLRGTLVSRFQKIYFGAVAEKDVSQWLQKNGFTKEKAAAAARACGGKPGLALKLASGASSETEEAARKFLRTQAAGRKEFLKALLDDEQFNFRAFLDALILLTALNPQKNGALWHAVLELRAISDATGLNPRIQLMSLGAYL